MNKRPHSAAIDSSSATAKRASERLAPLSVARTSRVAVIDKDARPAFSPTRPRLPTQCKAQSLTRRTVRNSSRTPDAFNSTTSCESLSRDNERIPPDLGRMRVYVRPKPMKKEDKDEGWREALEIDQNGMHLALVERCSSLSSPPSSADQHGGPSGGHRRRRSTNNGASGNKSLNRKTFAFDKVFPSHATNREVFKSMCASLVHSALSGFHGTLLAYGQTGSGKSMTLSSDDGMIPRSVREVFKRVERDKVFDYSVGVSYIQVYQEKVFDLLAPEGLQDAELPLREHPVTGVYVEGLTKHIAKDEKKVLELLSFGRKRLVFAETKMNRASSRSHALCLLHVRKWVKGNTREEEGYREELRKAKELDPLADNRNAHARTSRSRPSSSASVTDEHAIVGKKKRASNSLPVQNIELAFPPSPFQDHLDPDYDVSDEDGMYSEPPADFYSDLCTVDSVGASSAEFGPASLDRNAVYTGKLILCDLAGSERVKRTDVSGLHLTEAKDINLSLLELGNVIQRLASKTKTHIPYRNATLTRLLQESLSGNTKTALIICVSSSEKDVGETKGSLMFGHRALRIKMRPKVNVMRSPSALAERLELELRTKELEWRNKERCMLEEIASLREHVRRISQKTTSPVQGGEWRETGGSDEIRLSSELEGCVATDESEFRDSLCSERNKVCLRSSSSAGRELQATSSFPSQTANFSCRNVARPASSCDPKYPREQSWLTDADLSSHEVTEYFKIPRLLLRTATENTVPDTEECDSEVASLSHNHKGVCCDSRCRRPCHRSSAHCILDGPTQSPVQLPTPPLSRLSTSSTFCRPQDWELCDCSDESFWNNTNGLNHKRSSSLSTFSGAPGPDPVSRTPHEQRSSLGHRPPSLQATIERLRGLLEPMSSSPVAKADLSPAGSSSPPLSEIRYFCPKRRALPLGSREPMSVDNLFDEDPSRRPPGDVSSCVERMARDRWSGKAGAQDALRTLVAEAILQDPAQESSTIELSSFPVPVPMLLCAVILLSMRMDSQDLLRCFRSFQKISDNAHDHPGIDTLLSLLDAFHDSKEGSQESHRTGGRGGWAEPSPSRNSTSPENTGEVDGRWSDAVSGGREQSELPALDPPHATISTDSILTGAVTAASRPSGGTRVVDGANSCCASAGTNADSWVGAEDEEAHIATSEASPLLEEIIGHGGDDTGAPRTPPSLLIRSQRLAASRTERSRPACSKTARRSNPIVSGTRPCGGRSRLPRQQRSRTTYQGPRSGHDGSRRSYVDYQADVRIPLCACSIL